MTVTFQPVRVDAPLMNPSPGGLYGVTTWQNAAEGDPLRWLPDGVEIVPSNFGGDEAFGIWGADWCASEEDLTSDDVKDGERPDIPDPFMAVTVWAADKCRVECGTLEEVKARAAQTFRMRESIAVEKEFSARLLADAGTPDTAADIIGAVGHLEELFAIDNVVGYVHARPSWIASAAQANLLRYVNGRMVTPGGHAWVFGGGYAGAGGLADTLVATSPTYGWRSPVVLRTPQVDFDQHLAVAERSVVVGYEQLIGAVDVTG